MRPKWTRLSLVTSLAATLTWAAFACGGSHRPGTPSLGEAPFTTSATAPSPTLDEPRECGVADLLITIEGQNSAKFQEAAHIVMANTSAVPCTLAGYPSLEFHTPSGPMPTTVTHGEGTVATVTLRPGQVASTMIVWDKYEGDGNSCPPFPTEISIALPNQAEAKTIPWIQGTAGSVCGGKIAASPIEDGA
jgi:hypothetical protein